MSNERSLRCVSSKRSLRSRYVSNERSLQVLGGDWSEEALDLRDTQSM